MGGLIGRGRELGILRGFLSDPVMRGCAVYGIRRVGKSFILMELSTETRCVYIQASDGSEEKVIERAMSDVKRSFQVDEEPRTFSGLLDVLEDICEEAPTLVIIDEYPYMSRSMEHADSMLQGFMDRVIPRTGSKMIICGSHLSSMLEIVDDKSHPLFDRFRFTLEVTPLSFHDTCLFHPGMSDQDRIRMYMMLGGMPEDHLEFNGDSFREVVENRLLSPGLPLSKIARGRISSRLGSVEGMELLLRVIADGASTVKEIIVDSGMPKSTCIKYLGRLVEAGILRTKVPMGNAPKADRYMIVDGMVGLWYTVFDDLNEFLMPTDVHARYELVDQKISTFMGHQFELFCAEYLAQNYVCDRIGTWWGSEETDDGEVDVDIDIVARVRENGKRFLLCGECEFRNKMMKLSDLKTLERRARRLDPNSNLILFSAGGFERELAALAWNYGAVLIGPDELMGREPAPRLLQDPFAE